MRPSIPGSIACLALTFLIAMSVFGKDPYADHPWIPVAHEVRTRAINELAKKYDLRPCGCGGQLMTGVDKLTLAFDVHREIEKDQARVLIVRCAQDFLAIIDESEAIRPYLKRTPCPVELAEVILYFWGSDGRSPLLPLVCVVGVHGGIIRYRYDDETTRRKAYKRVDKETFEEARAIVNAAGSDVDRPESDT